MNKNPIVIINNEKVFKEGNDYYCDNLDMKVLPEGLASYNQTQFIARKSKKKGGHKIQLENIKVANNIFNFLYSIFKTFKIKNVSYLLVAITPYTFFSFLFLFLFRKKIFIYLRSSGHEEWRYILGAWSVWIYHIMYKIVTTGSVVIVLNSRLFNKKKCHLVNPSRLDGNWLKNYKDPPLDKIRLLYVGRINPEKGIYDFIKMFDNLKLNAEFSIVGNSKNLKVINNNIKFLGHLSDSQSLIQAYDDHNITILPSFTEGQPYTLDESLSRKRPMIIFEDIDYIVKDRKGIFISKRDVDSLSESINYIMQNYQKIQKNIEQNKFYTKEDMLKQISNIVSNEF